MSGFSCVDWASNSYSSSNGRKWAALLVSGKFGRSRSSEPWPRCEIRPTAIVWILSQCQRGKGRPWEKSSWYEDTSIRGMFSSLALRTTSAFLQTLSPASLLEMNPTWSPGFIRPMPLLSISQYLNVHVSKLGLYLDQCRMFVLGLAIIQMEVDTVGGKWVTIPNGLEGIGEQRSEQVWIFLVGSSEVIKSWARMKFLGFQLIHGEYHCHLPYVIP